MAFSMKEHKNNRDLKSRKIHITLSESVHQRLRVKCAFEDLTIQDYVSEMISLAVQDITVMDNRKATMKET